jgi:hypothetical protein
MGGRLAPLPVISPDGWGFGVRAAVRAAGFHRRSAAAGAGVIAARGTRRSRVDASYHP